MPQTLHIWTTCTLLHLRLLERGVRRQLTYVLLIANARPCRPAGPVVGPSIRTRACLEVIRRVNVAAIEVVVRVRAHPMRVVGLSAVDPLPLTGLIGTLATLRIVETDCIAFMRFAEG